MRYLLSGMKMKEVDRYTIENVGIPSIVLMERAAWSVVEEMRNEILPHDKIWVVCGSGNNGADGIAAARMLHIEGFPVMILLTAGGKKGTSEYEAQLAIARKLHVEILEYNDFIPGRCDILIDAVFGSGLDRDVEGDCRELFSMLTSMRPRLRIAVDVPSGIHADTGAVMGIALRADITVTFGWEKLGTMLYPGKSYSGRVVVANIGFPVQSLRYVQPKIFTYGPEDMGRIPARPSYSNKGTFGKVLVVAGSANMSGAACFSSLAAYRTGAGIVKIFTVEENRVILQTQLPEAILTVFNREEAEADDDAFRKLLEEQCQWASVIVLGPGIGREPYTKSMVETVLSRAYVPIIIDADGLNVIADYRELTSYYTENIIITPHLGEMARLTDRTLAEIQGQLLSAAREYADCYGITCVLKDAVTVAALNDGTTFLNSSGNSAMAKAGSGDVLTGIIAGLCATGFETAEAASMGVYLHGRAGDFVKEGTGEHSLIARELTDAIPHAIRGWDLEGDSCDE